MQLEHLIYIWSTAPLIYCTSDLLHLLSNAHLTYCASYLLRIWSIPPIIYYCTSHLQRFPTATLRAHTCARSCCTRIRFNGRAPHTYPCRFVFHTHIHADSQFVPIYLCSTMLRTHKYLCRFMLHAHPGAGKTNDQSSFDLQQMHTNATR